MVSRNAEQTSQAASLRNSAAGDKTTVHVQRIAAGPRSFQIVNTETNDRDPRPHGRTSAPSGARRTRN